MLPHRLILAYSVVFVALFSHSIASSQSLYLSHVVNCFHTHITYCPSVLAFQSVSSLAVTTSHRSLSKSFQIQLSNTDVQNSRLACITPSKSFSVLTESKLRLDRSCFIITDFRCIYQSDVIVVKNGINIAIGLRHCRPFDAVLPAAAAY